MIYIKNSDVKVDVSLNVDDVAMIIPCQNMSMLKLRSICFVVQTSLENTQNTFRTSVCAVRVDNNLSKPVNAFIKTAVS